MPKSTVSKLVPKVPPLPSVPGVSRRQQYSTSTKNALVEVAEELFTANGYASTSLDAIVAGAEVTKGALYHHFSGKQALFEAVFEKVETEASAKITRAMKDTKDAWNKTVTGLRTFLEVVQQPDYRRIVIQEGPAVLGYERFREQEERTAYTVLLNIVEIVLSVGGHDVDDLMTSTVARVFFGALSAAGDAIAAADTPEDAERAAARVEEVVTYILTGMQTLAEQGVHLSDDVE